MDQRLIEHDLPLVKISEESAREKFVRHGHPSTLHTWWARRPLATSRATSFAALVDDPGPHSDGRKKLKNLIRQIVSWDNVKDGNSKKIREARKKVVEKEGEAPKVLDPFAGGGTIPLELLRLGCEVHSTDYNPVAVLVEKATLEWPQRMGKKIEISDGNQTDLGMGGEQKNLLLHLVQKWSGIVEDRAREEIGQYYPSVGAEDLVGADKIEEQEDWIPVAYLWARQLPCQNPQCGVDMPLVGQYWLSRKDDKRIAYRPYLSEDEELSFELLEGGLWKLQSTMDSTQVKGRFQKGMPSVQCVAKLRKMRLSVLLPKRRISENAL